MQEKYKKLLTIYTPKIIKTEAENQQDLLIIEELMHHKRTHEKNEFYQLLM